MKIFRTTSSGYTFDKRFFWGAEILMLLGLFVFFWSFNFDFSYHPYFVCDKPTCVNPFYESDTQVIYNPPIISRLIPSVGKLDCDWCKEQTLYNGVYGKAPPSKYLVMIMPISVLLLFGLAVLFNHLTHNKGKKFNLGLKEQYSWMNKFKEEKNDDVGKNNL